MNRGGSDGQRWIRWGVVADAAFKVALALAYLTLAVPASDTLDVPTWLIYVTAPLLLASGFAEFRGRRLPPVFTVTALSIFDAGFAVLTVLALVLGRQLGAHYAGELWFGYQAIASTVLAIVTLAVLRRPARQERSRIANT